MCYENDKKTKYKRYLVIYLVERVNQFPKKYFSRCKKMFLIGCLAYSNILK